MRRQPRRHARNTMHQPLVSIMMPAYNAAPYIGQAIESALAQTFSDWELIIVDDGSTDGTGDIAARYGDPRICVLSQTNAGESAARNRALAAMNGKYVAFLDADDLFLSDHLRLTVGRLESDHHLGGVYTNGLHCDETGARLAPLSSRRRGPFEGDLFEPLVRASDIFGPPLSVVIRREVIRKHDLQWDPAIVIGPDWDFFIRYAQFARFGYVAESTCLYRVHRSNITVLTGVQKRRASLALCREKTIALERFAGCSLETRAWVFYDLLVELLDGQPERQAAIISGPAFQALPNKEKARLQRLMASRAIRTGEVEGEYVTSWLAASRALDGADVRGAALAMLYGLSPGACRFALRAIRYSNDHAEPVNPLADLLREPITGRSETQ